MSWNRALLEKVEVACLQWFTGYHHHMESCIHLDICFTTTVMTMMMAVVATTKSRATITKKQTNEQITKCLYYFKTYYYIKCLDPTIASASYDCTAALFGITDSIKLERKTEVA